MTQRAFVAADATPLSAADRQAYIQHEARSWRPLEYGVPIRLPVLGGAYLESEWHRERAFESSSDLLRIEISRPGAFALDCGRLRFLADMPDQWFQVSDEERRVPATLWYLVGLPILGVLMFAWAPLRALSDPLRWRLKRATMRVMWLFQPAGMDAKVVAWRAEAAARDERWRQYKEQEEAKEVARKAAYEAEIERRVAERMAALGVA